MWIPTPEQYGEYAESLCAKSRLPRTDDRDDEWRDPATYSKAGRRVITPH